MAFIVFEGITRKVALAFIGLAFIGWILFEAGFGKYYDEAEEKNEAFLYAFYAGAVLGPIVCILAVVHALLWGYPSAIVGSITAILTIIYISAIGFVLVLAGFYVKYDIENKLDESDERFRVTYNLMFTGGLITTLFWLFTLALWPWYKVSGGGQFSGV